MTDNDTISAQEVFSTIQPFVEKKKVIPILIFGIDLFCYLFLFYLIIIAENLFIKFSLGIIEGFFISFLFVVGHDCCHGSFTTNKKLNKCIGNIAFLPSLHNFSLWEVWHNKIHHGFTNLKSKDFVYTPLSPYEYLELSSFQKFRYRVYRSSFGHLPYYLCEMWWKKMVIPRNDLPDISSSKKHWLQVIPLLIYGIGVLSIVFWMPFGSIQTLILNIVFALLIPFLTWNWLIGFATYQHHTNQFTKWFEREDEWNYWEVQVEHTTHIDFPRPINQLFHNIMEHTAHHSNMDIPLYNLAKAQSAINKKFKERINTIKWSWKFYFASIDACKLYDYDLHEWFSFEDVKLNRIEE